MQKKRWWRKWKLFKLIGVEYLKGQHFPDTIKALDGMKPIVASDNSSANLHSIFLGKCSDVDGRAFRPGLCTTNNNLNANCHNKRRKPVDMGFTIAHEVGHNLGR